MDNKFYSFTLLLLLLTFPLYAQTNKADSYLLKGQVIDSLTNETVPYATIKIALVSNPQKPVKMLASNEDGKFETTLAAPGSYEMVVNSVGLAPTIKRFTLVESRKTHDFGNVFMSESSERLAEVTVTAQKPLVKIDIDKLTYSIEDDPEAQTVNTLDMLRKVPMVTVDGEDKIQLKGADNFKIYLNGKPSNMLSSNNASDVLKSMPASTVKNIEVITEPGAKYDAEGVGGIINIVTTRNALQGYTATLRGDVSSIGRAGGGANFSLKAGKFGLTGNYNYRYNTNPWNESGYTREIPESGKTPHSLLTQDGRAKNWGNFQFGSLEMSYEVDSLNLLSVGANLFNGKFSNKSELEADMFYETDTLLPYSYEQYGRSKSTFGSFDMNVDFQHSTKKKDELLTFSYRFSNSPNDDEGFTYLENLNGYYYRAGDYPRSNDNDAHTNEHTAQVDYTTPTLKDQTLETGVKYIMRQSVSNTITQVQDVATGQWHDDSNITSDFKHTQHIYSAYLAYALKLNKFGIKAGVRAEGTSLNAKFNKAREQDFNTDFFNVVPNATISYQINMAQQIRLGYNMRISRPGIWYLNPYVNDNDPQNISYGNPHLDAEKSHGVNMNYSMFTRKFNFNANLSYRFVNNGIESYSFINPEENNRRERTYYNMGKNHTVGIYLYGRVNPIPLFNISVNAGLDYRDMESKARNLKKDGFQGRIFANGQINLPKDFNVMLFGGYYSGWLQLQSKSNAGSFHGITLNKNFLDKRLTIGISANSPFQKNRKWEQTTDGDGFREINTNFYRQRDFSLRVSYRFGTLKDSIKKVRRGISNDDQKSGGGEGGGGGEQQTM